MSGEILQDFSCEFIHDGDSCKLVDFLVDENSKLRAACDVWAENDAKLRELLSEDNKELAKMRMAIDYLYSFAKACGVDAEDMRELGVNTAKEDE